MKNVLLFVCPFLIFFLTGCASTKNSSNNTKVQIVEATYHHWTEKLPNTSLPESGIDLRLILNKWPKDYEPAYIVFHNYKTGSAAVTDSTGEQIEISARIIRSSGLLAETSSKTELSDRLVYTTTDGDTAFVEIEDWQKAE